MTLLRRLWSFILLASGCGGGEVCDAEGLTNALSGGGRVDVGDCRIVGSFVVGSGTSIVGRGPSSIIASTEGATLELRAGMERIEISDLSIESGSGVGILAKDPGAIAIERVDITSMRGVAVGIERSQNATFRSVRIRGNPSERTATHGLILVRAAASLEDVDISGFGSYGFLGFESQTTWTRGSVSGNLGVGILAEGGSTFLESVTVDGTVRGSTVFPAYSVVGSGGTLQSTGLRITNSEEFGLLLEGAGGAHSQLDISDNARAGVWIQNTSDVELSGRLAGNRRAGIVAIDSSGISVHDAQIESTRSERTLIGGEGRIADGVHVVRSVTDLSLRNLTLAGNERIGVLLELGGQSVDSGIMSSVMVSSTSSAALGVIAQGGTASFGWDSGVTRGGTTGANDLLHTGDLSTIGVVGPCFMPPVDLEQGLSQITGM